MVVTAFDKINQCFTLICIKFKDAKSIWENWGKKFQENWEKFFQEKPKKANVIVFNKKVANCI